MSDILARIFDQALNRISGVYTGFTPSRPNALVIPGFVCIEPRLSSLLEAVSAWVDLDRMRAPLVVSDRVTWEIAGSELFGEMRDAGLDPRQALVSSNRYEEAEQIALDMSFEPRVWSEAARPWERRLYAPKACSMVFGVGGGTVIDIAKLCALHLNLPCVTVPTSLAHDGIASPFAVIRPSGGDPSAVTVTANTPLGVLIDLSRIKPRPGCDEAFFSSMMRSGIGDALSNLSASLDWKLAASRGHDTIDYLAFLHARSAGEVLLVRLRQGASLDDDDLILTLAAGLVSSGEAMARVGSSRPASGFEHKLYHAFQNILGFRSRASHGVLVAVGTLVSARAHGQFLEELLDAFEKVGLPTDLASLRALDIEPAQVEEAIRVAARVKPERYTILEELGAPALVDAFRTVYG